MKRTGFTLMELLAVIVLLAIIATIAIPIFLKAIEKSKTTSYERRADLYVGAVEVAIATENLDGNFNPEECVVQQNGNIKCDDDKVLEVEMKGEKPTYGTLTINGGKVSNFIDLKFEDKYVTMGENGKHTVSIESVDTSNQNNEEMNSSDIPVDVNQDESIPEQDDDPIPEQDDDPIPTM